VVLIVVIVHIRANIAVVLVVVVYILKRASIDSARVKQKIWQRRVDE
jgi:hypothetical protein